MTELGQEIKRLMHAIKDENPDVEDIILEGTTAMGELPIWEPIGFIPGKITYSVTVEFIDGDSFTVGPYDDCIEAIETAKERLSKWFKT